METFTIRFESYGKVYEKTIAAEGLTWLTCLEDTLSLLTTDDLFRIRNKKKQAIIETAKKGTIYEEDV